MRPMSRRFIPFLVVRKLVCSNTSNIKRLWTIPNHMIELITIEASSNRDEIEPGLLLYRPGTKKAARKPFRIVRRILVTVSTLNGKKYSVIVSIAPRSPVHGTKEYLCLHYSNLGIYAELRSNVEFTVEMLKVDSM